MSVMAMLQQLLAWSDDDAQCDLRGKPSHSTGTKVTSAGYDGATFSHGLRDDSGSSNGIFGTPCSRNSISAVKSSATKGSSLKSGKSILKEPSDATSAVAIPT